MYRQSRWRSVRVHAIDRKVKWLSACSLACSLGPEEQDRSRSECAVSFRLRKISKDGVSARYISYNGLGDRLFESHEDQEIYVFSRSSRPVLGFTHPLIQKVLGLFSGDKSAGA
jgi:hypothetical protein